MVKKRRRHSTAFKVRTALETLEGTKTVSHLPSKHDLHANPIPTRKQHLPNNEPSTKLSAWTGPASPTPTTTRAPSPTSPPSA